LNRITSLGYLHYGDHLVQPLEALKTAIRGLPDALTDALIVLPEAFNAGSNDAYYTKAVEPDRTVLEKVRELGIARRLTFVAGLITHRSSDTALPFSSAYLLDPENEHPTLLCHKEGRDGAPYQACETDADRNNGIKYRNAAIGALICMDAYDDVWRESKRIQDLNNKLTIPDVDARILCVPARSTGWCTRLAKVRNAYVVLANGTKTVASSVDYNNDKTEIEELMTVAESEKQMNLIQTVPLVKRV
jgi:hypothetical protein